MQVVALDPGVRCFQTAYSPNGESAAYCQGRNGYNIVFSLAERVDKIASTLDEDKKAKHKLLTPRKRSHLKKEINRLRQRSQNLVTEVRELLKQGKKKRFHVYLPPLLSSPTHPTRHQFSFYCILQQLHRKVANDLCTNFDTILLPSFETSKMVKKRDDDGNWIRKINHKTARGIANTSLMD